MKSKKAFDKDILLCILAMIITSGAYGFQKVFELNFSLTRVTGLVLAMVYTALLGIVVLILSRCRNPFYGMLTSLIAYKMMPVGISMLSTVSYDGSILYYLVRKAAVIIFVVLLYKFYNMQGEPREIKALPVLAMILAVPFFQETGVFLTQYFEVKTGSMMLGFLSQYAMYAVASVVILGLAFASSYESMRFAKYFEYAALGINIVRRAGKIAAYKYLGYHVSRSLYVWIAVYVILGILFVLATEYKKRTQAKTTA